jgi:tetratricopeptide (TPR) repeat protein
MLELVPAAPLVTAGPEAPLVGREEELAQLGGILARTFRERIPHLVTVLGPAGIGKSRLAREFAALVGADAAVFTGRCLSYGEGITFWPLREIVYQAAGEVTREGVLELLASTEDAALVADHLAAALNFAEAGGAREEEIFWAVRRLLETLAEERPLVVVLEDLHWAEATFLDLVEHLAEWMRDTPLLLLCLARPELIESRPRWGGGTRNTVSLHLEPLAADESQRLIEELPGGAELHEATSARLLATGEGNPLFLEQLLALVREGTQQGEELPIPPTIAALMAARLDRLGPAERAVLEAAAVVGKECSLDALVALLPEEAQRTAAGHLESLVRKQFVWPVRVSGKRDAFRFSHILVQQAAYRAIPKELRAGLHERCATWLSSTADARAGELDEILGYHLEQAFGYHEELGSVDSDARMLANRASDLLESAARRAGARGDDRAAANLLRRARALLPPEDPRLPPLGVALADALSMVGDLEEAEDLYRETIRMAAARIDRRTEWLATMEHVALKAHLEPASWNADEVRRTAQQALAVFEELGDHLGLARAWKLLGYGDWYLCRFEPVAKAYERGLVHARRSGDERTRRHLAGSLSAALYYGPTPAPEAIARISELLAEEGGRALEADGLVQLAGLHTMQGHFEEGRTLYEQAKAIRWELGLKRGVATATMHAREIHLLGGDADGAVRELLWGYETLEQMGEKAGRSTLAADLAEALYCKGRYEEADHFAHVALQAASPEDVASQVMGRVVSAKLLAVKRMHDDAEETAREAVALAETTDDLFTLGQAYEALAEVLLLANRREEAIAALQAAAEASERKGNLVTAENARGLLDSLRRSPRSDVLGNRTH